MLRVCLLLLSVLSLVGCDRLLGADDAPPVVAPVAPPQVTIATNLRQGATLYVDGQDRGPLVNGARVAVGPGAHVFEARRDDEILARVERTLESGREAEVRLMTTSPPGAEPLAGASKPGAAPVTRATVAMGEIVLEEGREAMASEARRALRARVRSIQSCYERALRTRPGARGEVRLLVRVAPTGTVMSAEVVEGVDAEVDACARDAVRRLRFARSDGGRFRTSFSFSSPSVEAAPSAARPTPSRGEVVGAMRAVEPLVRACSRGRHGVASVRFTFRGSDGAVESAPVSGDWPAEVVACVERAAMTARVAPFSRERFSVSYPFRL